MGHTGDHPHPPRGPPWETGQKTEEFGALSGGGRGDHPLLPPTKDLLLLLSFWVGGLPWCVPCPPPSNSYTQFGVNNCDFYSCEHNGGFCGVGTAGGGARRGCAGPIPPLTPQRPPLQAPLTRFGSFRPPSPRPPQPLGSCRRRSAVSGLPLQALGCFRQGSGSPGPASLRRSALSGAARLSPPSPYGTVPKTAHIAPPP